MARRVLAERAFETAVGKGWVLVSDRDPCWRVRIATPDGAIEVEGKTFPDVLMQLARIVGLLDEAMKTLNGTQQALVAAERKRERARR